jgi:hypothetical protein
LLHGFLAAVMLHSPRINFVRTIITCVIGLIIKAPYADFLLESGIYIWCGGSNLSELSWRSSVHGRCQTQKHDQGRRKCKRLHDGWDELSEDLGCSCLGLNTGVWGRLMKVTLRICLLIRLSWGEMCCHFVG